MSSPALHVIKPGYTEPRILSPLDVKIESTALLDVIEAIYYDNSEAEDAECTRLIGTLLGMFLEDGSVKVKAAYIVPHKEVDGDLIFEETHHYSTYQLYKRSNMDLQVVGWFQTNENIDIYTGLLHDFYTKASPKSTQILLTLNHKDAQGNVVSPILKTYVSAPIGLPAVSPLTKKLGLDKSGAHAFVPINNQITYSQRELTSLKFITQASQNAHQTVPISSNDDLTQLQTSVAKIADMISILSQYSEKASNGELEGNAEIGQLLLSALKYNIDSTNISKLKSQIENHVNDTLLIEYLSSCIKQQLDLSSKLTNFVLPEDALKQ